MTEQQWLTSDSASIMLTSLLLGNSKQTHPGLEVSFDPLPCVTFRKLRLLACACARFAWNELEDMRHRHAVEMGEDYADDRCPLGKLAAAWGDANTANRPDQGGYDVFGVIAATAAARDCDLVPALARWLPRHPAAVAAMQEIFGNPFQQQTFSAFPGRYHFEAARELAQNFYNRRDWGALPVLADALEDAGFDNAPALAHLREQQDQPCPACGGTGKVRVPGGHGDWDTVLCAQCNPNENDRIRGFASPTSGRVGRLHARGCWVLDLVLGKE